jgi:hypothetical protein
VKIGMSREAAIRAAGRPGKSTGRSLSWCVTGGGRTTAALTRGGTVRLVVTTARGRAPAGAARGSSLSRMRRVHGKLRRVGKAVYTASRRGPFVFGVRRNRVLYVAVTPRGMSRGQLGPYLRLAGLR